MFESARSLLRRRYAPVLAWAVLVTLAMAWPVAFPHVAPQGMTVREDTTNFTMFEMSGDNYAAILGAVESGRLSVSEMRDGFRLFTRGTLSKRQLVGRVRVGGQVIDQYIAEHRAAARPMLVGIWVALALLLPGLYLAGRAVWRPRPRLGQA
jgi:hypothetical protein